MYINLHRRIRTSLPFNLMVIISRKEKECFISTHFKWKFFYSNQSILFFMQPAIEMHAISVSRPVDFFSINCFFPQYISEELNAMQCKIWLCAQMIQMCEVFNNFHLESRRNALNRMKQIALLWAQSVKHHINSYLFFPHEVWTKVTCLLLQHETRKNKVSEC